MTNSNDIFYEAMTARDYRFDGKFFVGVKTTGIYCRPICPAKPKRENVEFFQNAIQAESAGYRPCKRCHPESAPMSALWIGKSDIVRRAARMLYDKDFFHLNEDEFASRFHISARHLRRLFTDEIGKTPLELAHSFRLNLSSKLIKETSMPVSDIAFASGFQSLRRFNDAFKKRFQRSPTEYRSANPKESSGIRISLPYRPPYDFSAILNFYRVHQIGNLESFTDHSMTRIFELDGTVGSFTITADGVNHSLIADIEFADRTKLYEIVHRLRSMFDLDSDPILIANALEGAADLEALWKKHPGVRLPSGWEPFEIAISTILGQLVSLERARVMTADLIEIAGRDTGLKTPDGKAIKLFPTPEEILRADLNPLKSTNARKQALVSFSQLVHDKVIRLDSAQDPQEFMEKVLAVKGIGPWTANYMTLKALRNVDSFPATDLILQRALEFHPIAVIDSTRPWRGYMAALLWREYYHLLSKSRGKKDEQKTDES